MGKSDGQKPSPVVQFSDGDIREVPGDTLAYSTGIRNVKPSDHKPLESFEIGAEVYVRLDSVAWRLGRIVAPDAL